MTRFQITFGGALVALAALATYAHADAFECRKTETQAECFARLKCHADEEIEDCQKRLRSQPQQNGAGSHGDDRGGDDRGGNDRGGNDRGGNDRGGDDRGGNDRGGNDRDNDRDRDDGGSRGGGGSSRGRRRHSGGGSRRFEANKTFGLGLELGEPTGLTGKFFFSPRAALDFGVGWIYRHYYYGDGFHVYADLLFHPVSLTHNDTFELPFYIGGGLRYWDFDYCDGPGLCNYGGSAIGIRIPFGIDFDFNRTPLDIFIQFVPTIDFLGGDYYDRYRDRNHFGVDFSVGLRFWFK